MAQARTRATRFATEARHFQCPSFRSDKAERHGPPRIESRLQPIRARRRPDHGRYGSMRVLLQNGRANPWNGFLAIAVRRLDDASKSKETRFERGSASSTPPPGVDRRDTALAVPRGRRGTSETGPHSQCGNRQADSLSAMTLSLPRKPRALSQACCWRPSSSPSLVPGERRM